MEALSNARRAVSILGPNEARNATSSNHDCWHALLSLDFALQRVESLRVGIRLTIACVQIVAATLTRMVFEVDIDARSEDCDACRAAEAMDCGVTFEAVAQHDQGSDREKIVFGVVHQPPVILAFGTMPRGPC